MKIKYCPKCGHSLITTNIENRKRLTCPECGWINYKNPIPCVAALVRNQDDKILLVKRGVSPSKGSWCLPTGFMEIEETPEKACLRELKEETGLRGSILGLIGVYTQRTKIYRNILVIAYEVKAEGEPQAGSDTKEA
ncbi:MAG TPA: NUDIX hydrolase, partial [bacterium (Candidatus Stahlbacteria)]|nr:NUDIX hydrolase [Candidatus Stahlbacteria bacterium]